MGAVLLISLARLQTADLSTWLFTTAQNANSDSDDSGENDDLYEGIDPNDPMAAYLLARTEEQRALARTNGTYQKKTKSST